MSVSAAMDPPRSSSSELPNLPGWLKPFEPNRWWSGGWLQTFSTKLIRTDFDPKQWPGITHVQVPDNGSSSTDLLQGYFLPTGDVEKTTPLVLLVHGMGGQALSGYMRSLARTLLNAGYSVLMWNNRGAGASAEHCRRLHHPGKIEDLKLLIDYLKDQQPGWIQHGIGAVGFSLGGSLLLRCLAEYPAQIDAAVTISAPLDMEIVSRKLTTGRNRFFDSYLRRRLRGELLRSTTDLNRHQQETIRFARSVWQLDDRFTAPYYGYRGAAEYYQDHSPLRTLDQIRRPTLLLHAADDPVVAPDVIRVRDWGSDSRLIPCLVRSGGHAGFLDKNWDRWHEQMVVTFFDRQFGSTG